MRLLVLQLKRIGDLILTTPALAALKARLPEVHVTLVINEVCAGLIPAMPYVDEVLVTHRQGNNAGVWTRLFLKSYDVCLDFTGNDRSAFFSLLSKARRRIAFRRAQKQTFQPLFFNEFVDSSVRENHTIDHLLDLLQPLGIQERGAPVTLKLPESARESASRLLGTLGLPSRFAVLHPGTARPEKYWLPERWAAIVDYCQEALGLPCVVTGSRDAFEQNHIAAIAAGVRTPFRDLSRDLDLLTLAALIERTVLLLSMDSAPVHLGAAFGTRQISLFGETNPFHWRPRHERSSILFAGGDGPLHEFSPSFHRRPLSDLSTQAVRDAIASSFPR